MTQAGQFKQQTPISHSLESGRSKTEVPADLLSPEGVLCGALGNGGLWSPLLVRTLIPLWGLHPHDLIYT